MESQILLDTNILIAAFRRDAAAIDFLSRKQFRYVISDITIMELLAGCKTIKRRNEIEKVIETYDRAPFNESVVQKAISLIRRYSVRQYSIHLPDLLIAATAFHYQLPLKSFNTKDFEFIREIELL
jgi:predicted nucleic acid-binding protein